MSYVLAGGSGSSTIPNVNRLSIWLDINMKLDFSIFANYADVTERGLLSMIGGGVDFAEAPKFPARMHSLYLIVKIILLPKEAGTDKVLRIQVQGPEKPAIPDVRMNISSQPHPRKKSAPNWSIMTVHYMDISFPVPGDYIFKFSVDGKSIGKTTFEIVKTQED